MMMGNHRARIVSTSIPGCQDAGKGIDVFSRLEFGPRAEGLVEFTDGFQRFATKCHVATMDRAGLDIAPRCKLSGFNDVQDRYWIIVRIMERDSPSYETDIRIIKAVDHRVDVVMTRLAVIVGEGGQAAAANG